MANSANMRLAKAAREFNVGVTTIIDFLKKKGFDEDFNPNSKLTPEMVSHLVAEYQSEKEVKEKAHERVLSTDRTPVSLNKEEEEEDTSEDTAGDELIIKDSSLSEDKPLKKKIDPKPELEDVVEETSSVTEETTDEPAQEKSENEVVSETEVEKEAEAEIVDKKETPEPPVQEESQEEIQTPEPPKEEKTESSDTSSQKEDEQAEEHEGPHPKVIDKIDLDHTNWSTRPKPKSREEKKKEKQKKEQARKAEIAKAKEDKAKAEQAKKAEQAQKESTPVKETAKENQIETIRARADKLSGPKVLGSIKLEESKPKKRQPEASSSDPRNKKKKRTRIKKPVSHDEGQNQQRNQKNQQAAADRQGRRKKKNTRHQAPKKVEPSEEEIKKQIKDTLARLAPAGKSKASKHRRQKRDQVSKQAEQEMQKMQEEQKVIKVTEYVTANELATMIGIPVTQVIATCMGIGLFVSINQRLDAETIVLVAEEFGYQVKFVGVEATEAIETDEDDYNDDDLEPRSPIVTVMGHVDHGKTKLLDYVRSANVVAGEAGGITQHIGAYEVTLEDGRSITFLDTPGHEAFTAMRARGAKVTDIAIIVIAADDKVMPQTKEAINHAQAAGIPIVFAINKVDRPTANPDAVKNELSQMNILVEDWGGKFQSQEISALKGTGVDELLEKVLLEAELLDLHATPKRRAVGSIIESSLDKGRGYVTKLLVQDGTLRIGDMVLAGSSYGKVKAMFNERNQAVTEAGPSAPVLMLGLHSAPQAGDNFNVLTDEREVKDIATKREQLQREQNLRTQKHITLDEIGRRLAIGDFQELNVIVKADVDGSVEALSDSLIKLSTDEIQLNVIHKSVGQISESDVLLASASDAIIVGFQVRPNLQARKLAETEGIQIKLYSIIYQAIEDVKLALEGMLSPEEEEKIVANVEVRETFKITKVGTIAGCMVLDGKITRNTPIRIIRDGVVIYTGKLGSLKRFKDDVKEVSAGYECGLNIENFNDIKVGDIVEGYDIVEIQRKL